MNTITARPAGKQAPRTEQRRTEARTVTVDCAPLLREYELLAQVLEIVAADGLACSARVRQGLPLELSFTGGNVPEGAPFADHLVPALVQTSQGQIEVRVEVRVHA